MNHVIITRANFSDDQTLRKYLPLINDVFIPCLHNQTCKKFKLHIIVQPRHTELFTNLFKGIDIMIIYPDERNRHSLKSHNTVMNIQTRHDCDDWMAPTYIEEIQKVYNTNTDPEYLVCAFPTILEYNTGKEYPKAHDKTRNVPQFLSLCQHHNDKYIYQHGHHEYRKYIPKMVVLNDDLVKWVMHDNNWGGGIAPNL